MFDRSEEIIRSRGEAKGLEKGKKERDALRKRVKELESALKPFAIFEPADGAASELVGKYGNIGPDQLTAAKKAFEK